MESLDGDGTWERIDRQIADSSRIKRSVSGEEGFEFRLAGVGGNLFLHAFEDREFENFSLEAKTTQRLISDRVVELVVVTNFDFAIETCNRAFISKRAQNFDDPKFGVAVFDDVTIAGQGSDDPHLIGMDGELSAIQDVEELWVDCAVVEFEADFVDVRSLASELHDGFRRVLST